VTNELEGQDQLIQHEEAQQAQSTPVNDSSALCAKGVSHPVRRHSCVPCLRHALHIHLHLSTCGCGRVLLGLGMLVSSVDNILITLNLSYRLLEAVKEQN
jgi:hypothetical protein